GGGSLSLRSEPEQRVALASSSRIEWILADLSFYSVGAATTAIYPATTPEDVTYILDDSEARIVFAENDEQVAKIVEHRSASSTVTKIVVFDGAADGDFVIGFDDLERLGRELLAERPSAVDGALAGVGPETLATLISTSGTTGRPKGVRLVNDNWTFEGVAIDELGILGIDDVQYLWLPLSHSFGKALEAIQLRIGFTTAVDGNLDRIVDNLGTVQPTFMAGAPRIFEKVRAKVITGVRDEGGVKEKIFDWAFGV